MNTLPKPPFHNKILSQQQIILTDIITHHINIQNVLNCILVDIPYNSSPKNISVKTVYYGNGG